MQPDTPILVSRRPFVTQLFLAPLAVAPHLHVPRQVRWGQGMLLRYLFAGVGTVTARCRKSGAGPRTVSVARLLRDCAAWTRGTRACRRLVYTSGEDRRPRLLPLSYAATFG